MSVKGYRKRKLNWPIFDHNCITLPHITFPLGPWHSSCLTFSSAPFKSKYFSPSFCVEPGFDDCGTVTLLEVAEHVSINTVHTHHPDTLATADRQSATIMSHRLFVWHYTYFLISRPIEGLGITPFVTWYYLKEEPGLMFACGCVDSLCGEAETLTAWACCWSQHCLTHSLPPEGDRTKTTALGLRLGLPPPIWLTVKKGGGGRPTLWNDSTITGSLRRPGVCTHLPKTDVKNKSERVRKKLCSAVCTSANSLQSKLTGEQTAAHDTHNTLMKETIACMHLTRIQSPSFLPVSCSLLASSNISRLFNWHCRIGSHLFL